MNKAIEVPCEDCQKIRLVKTNGMLLASYIKLKPVCRSCGARRVEDKISKGWFRKGQKSWNKGMSITTNTGRTHFKKGEHVSEKTELKRDDVLGELNNKWKGDSVGYYGLHTWLYRNLGKPGKCTICGSTKKVQWANKTYKYKRDVDDWVALCFACHRKYDSGKNWGKASKLFPEIRRK